MKTPKTFLVGVTQPDQVGLYDYLVHSGQESFFEQFVDAELDMGPICLASFYAKLCYKSLVLGQNQNVNKIRDIEDNIIGTFKSGHGSVFEHIWLNWITTDCSRVFTHELVRHRVGTAFSQTSGRYVALDTIDLVCPPELAEHADEIKAFETEIAQKLVNLRSKLINASDTFDVKKKKTSAIRRLAPNGQVNEIGWSCNIRSLRHMIEMRTSRHAEWEIRVIFNDVAKIILEHWPMMLYGHQVTNVDGLDEYTGLKV